ncbi:hypothetical protein OIDMADRAFT_36045 [Oidiodendron maius Zn]|uniref:Uncharacterized protein n=1 Tax=Oidiodendron maius (strain Zn) TaxID=913774 RepID=A0A0C3CTW7_OIDMZ|nr:hypothetical protein OIDMADRAFT_36045 [Oidiodendron maius Zn]
MSKPVPVGAAGIFHRYRERECVKDKSTQTVDAKGELESLTCDNPDVDWNAPDADEDIGMFPFSPTAFENCADDNLAATVPLHEADMLGMGCNLHPTYDDPAKKFRKTTLTTIAEEPGPEIGDEGGSGSDCVESSAADPSFADLLRNFQKQKLIELRVHLNMIQELGWDAFWMKAERRSIPADIFASILWMAEVLRTFGAPSQLTSANLLSVQLSLTSLKLALQYARDAQTAQVVAQIWHQMQNIINGAGITEVEFHAAVARFAAILDGVEDGESLFQVAYWFGHRGDRGLALRLVESIITFETSYESRLLGRLLPSPHCGPAPSTPMNIALVRARFGFLLGLPPRPEFLPSLASNTVQQHSEQNKGLHHTTQQLWTVQAAVARI